MSCRFFLIIVLIVSVFQQEIVLTSDASDGQDLVLNTGSYTVTGNDDNDGDKTDTNKALLDFYTPCLFPCYNFTQAFLAEANAVWFTIDSIKVTPNVTGKEVAITLQITRFCRLNFNGDYESDHIIVTAEQSKNMIKPEVGRSYVAAVIPNKVFQSHIGTYFLVTPLVPAEGHYPWRHLCRTCGFNASSVLAYDSYDTDQETMCTCPQEDSSRPCSQFVLNAGQEVPWAIANAHWIVGTVIGSVGAGFLLIVLAVGIFWWRWRTYKEKQRIDHSVVARTRGCALQHPGDAPPQNVVIQERHFHGEITNDDLTLTMEASEVTRRTSLVPLLMEHDDDEEDSPVLHSKPIITMPSVSENNDDVPSQPL